MHRRFYVSELRHQRALICSRVHNDAKFNGWKKTRVDIQLGEVALPTTASTLDTQHTKGGTIALFVLKGALDVFACGSCRKFLS